jgi:hypothetical protein
VRILFGPYETARVATALRDGLRARGHHAELWVTQPHPFFATHDRLVSGYPARACAGLIAPRRFDVLDYQFGTTYAEFADAAWARLAGRRLTVMHYWGDDCRIRTGGGLVPMGADAEWMAAQEAQERVIRRRMRLAARVCHAAVVPDLELAPHVASHFRTVYVVPTPIALPLEPGPKPAALAGDGPVVFHAPSHQLVKGTAAVTAAIDAVGRSRPLRPRVVTGQPRSAVLAELVRADVVVDQLNQQTTGVLALEAMALGRPVLSEIRRELLAPQARDAPVVPVTAATLETELTALLDDPARAARLGEDGRRFVARVHDAGRVAGLLERVYADARARRRGLFEVTEDGIQPLPSSAA